jgi:hypothetical protein
MIREQHIICEKRIVKRRFIQLPSVSMITDVVTVGDSYIAVLQVNIICSPPGEVSAGVQGQVVRARGLAGPRDTYRSRVRGLPLDFAWSADRARSHPPNPSFFSYFTLIIVRAPTYVDNGSAPFPSDGQHSKPRLMCTLGIFPVDWDKIPASKSLPININIKHHKILIS